MHFWASPGFLFRSSLQPHVLQLAWVPLCLQGSPVFGNKVGSEAMTTI